MKTYGLTFLQIGILTGARAIAAAGLALVAADRFRPEPRKAFGWALLGSGTIFYLALLLDLVLRNRRTPPPSSKNTSVQE